MEQTQIENLVKMLINSESKELYVEGEFAKIKIVRSYDEDIKNKPIVSKAKIEKEIKSKQSKNKTLEIKSNLVGNFHFEKQFNLGDKIIVGDKIGYVEALKTKTEITSDFSGYVVNIPTNDGEVVEFGQTIIVLE